MTKIAGSSEFEKETGEGTVIVDFFAPWCGPCRMMSQVLDGFEKRHPEVKVAQVNTDENPELAQAYAVKAIPTLVVFREGRHVNTVCGYQTEDALDELIRQP